MARKAFLLSLAFAAIFLAAETSFAQDRPIEETPLRPRSSRPEDPPQGVRDMLIRMQIEKAKKDFDEMLDRGDRAAKLSRQIESAIAKNSRVSPADREKLQALEKLTREVLNDLGGDEDDLLEESSAVIANNDPVATAKELNAAVTLMVAELKQMTRFTVSASAIESSGAVLRIARVLNAYK